MAMVYEMRSVQNNGAIKYKLVLHMLACYEVEEFKKNHKYSGIFKNLFSYLEDKHAYFTNF